MSKQDYISGTEDAYAESKKEYRVQVSNHAESDKSYGVLVDLRFDEKGICFAASRLEWFPKSLCSLEKVESPDSTKLLPTYFLTAPEWLLDKKNVKYLKL